MKYLWRTYHIDIYYTYHNQNPYLMTGIENNFYWLDRKRREYDIHLFVFLMLYMQAFHMN